MDKKNFGLLLFVLTISIVITIFIAMNLLDISDEVNQGSFRVNDLVINSYATIGENEENKNAQNISDLLFNLSQNNKITFLIAKNIDADRIYIDNIKFNGPVRCGSLILYQTDSEETYDLSVPQEVIEIKPIIKDEQYFVEFNIDNKEFIKDVKAPSNTNKITFDGTFFKDIDIKTEEIEMSIEGNLNIVDVTGKICTCKFNFRFPSEELLNNGISILRQDISKYVFKLK